MFILSSLKLNVVICISLGEYINAVVSRIVIGTLDLKQFLPKFKYFCWRQQGLDPLPPCQQPSAFRNPLPLCCWRHMWTLPYGLYRFSIKYIYHELQLCIFDNTVYYLNPLMSDSRAAFEALLTSAKILKFWQKLFQIKRAYHYAWDYCINILPWTVADDKVQF